MTIWFCIPSANRPVALETLSIWKRQGYSVALQLDPDADPMPSSCCDLQFYRPYKGWAESVNFLMRKVLDTEKDCTLLVTGGDDVMPDLNHSPLQIEDMFYERFPDGYGVMQPVGHGPTVPARKRKLQSQLAWSPLVGPNFAALSYGGNGPFHCGYFHCFVDNEMADVASQQGCWFPNENLTHDHLYFRWAGQPPTFYRKNIRRAHPHDQKLYWSRRAAGFPGSHRLDGSHLSGTGG